MVFPYEELYSPSLALLANVLCNRRFISEFAHRIHKVSVRPEFSSPKLPLHFWILFENLSRCDTLDGPNNLRRTQSWYRLNQKMYVILVGPYFKKSNLVPLLNFHTGIFQGVLTP